VGDSAIADLFPVRLDGDKDPLSGQTLTSKSGGRTTFQACIRRAGDLLASVPRMKVASAQELKTLLQGILRCDAEICCSSQSYHGGLFGHWADLENSLYWQELCNFLWLSISLETRLGNICWRH